jgi:hypothetical protein
MWNLFSKIRIRLNSFSNIKLERTLTVEIIKYAEKIEGRLSRFLRGGGANNALWLAKISLPWC